jgi:ElaB/YqjD/DUF883 family membrane-anchored ribosome-binding protein
LLLSGYHWKGSTWKRNSRKYRATCRKYPAAEKLEKLNQTLSGVSEQARTAAQYADRTVHSNPWASIGVGFGLGVVIGALVALAASSRNSG